MLKKLFGQRLKHIREERGISQEQLAESIGIKDSRTIRFWERGDRGPDSLDRIEKIAQTLGVEPWELLKEPDPN